MTTPPSVARQYIFGRSVVPPVRVAYSVEDTARAWGVTTDRITSAIHRGYLPARNHGNRYVVAGAVILDLAVKTPLIEINDHRAVIEPGRPYNYADLAIIFGCSDQAARRLCYSGRLVPDVPGTRPAFSGDLIRTYLEGCDKPITYHASA